MKGCWLISSLGIMNGLQQTKGLTGLDKKEISGYAGQRRMVQPYDFPMQYYAEDGQEIARNIYSMNKSTKESSDKSTKKTYEPNSKGRRSKKDVAIKRPITRSPIIVAPTAIADPTAPGSQTPSQQTPTLSPQLQTPVPTRAPCMADPETGLFGTMSDNINFVDFGYELETASGTSTEDIEQEILPAVELNLVNNLLPALFPEECGPVRMQRKWVVRYHRLLQVIDPPPGEVLVGISARPPDMLVEGVSCEVEGETRCDVVMGNITLFSISEGNLDASEIQQSIENAKAETFALIRDAIDAGFLDDSHDAVNDVRFVLFNNNNDNNQPNPIRAPTASPILQRTPTSTRNPSTPRPVSFFPVLIPNLPTSPVQPPGGLPNDGLAPSYASPTGEDIFPAEPLDVGGGPEDEEDGDGDGPNDNTFFVILIVATGTLLLVSFVLFGVGFFCLSRKDRKKSNYHKAVSNSGDDKDSATLPGEHYGLSPNRPTRVSGGYVDLSCSDSTENTESRWESLPEIESVTSSSEQPLIVRGRQVRGKSRGIHNDRNPASPKYHSWNENTVEEDGEVPVPKINRTTSTLANSPGAPALPFWWMNQSELNRDPSKIEVPVSNDDKQKDLTRLRNEEDSEVGTGHDRENTFSSDYICNSEENTKPTHSNETEKEQRSSSRDSLLPNFSIASSDGEETGGGGTNSRGDSTSSPGIWKKGGRNGKGGSYLSQLNRLRDSELVKSSESSNETIHSYETIDEQTEDSEHAGDEGYIIHDTDPSVSFDTVTEYSGETSTSRENSATTNSGDPLSDTPTITSTQVWI